MRVQHRKSGPSRTQRQFGPETDINRLVDRYIKTGVRDARDDARRPMFGDFSSVDFQTMMNKVADVQNQFRSLPSRLRARFQNNPYQLVRFVEDPKNRMESVQLGLVVPTEEEAAQLQRLRARAFEKRAQREGVQQDLVDDADAADALAAGEMPAGSGKPPKGGKKPKP